MLRRKERREIKGSMYYTRTVPLRRMSSALMLAAYVTGVDAVTQAERDRDWPEPIRVIADSASSHVGMMAQKLAVSSAADP